MDPGKALVADSKTMEIMEPGMSTFDYPAIFSNATAMLSAALRENRLDTPIAQFLPVCFGVVSRVTIATAMRPGRVCGQRRTSGTFTSRFRIRADACWLTSYCSCSNVPEHAESTRAGVI